MIYKFQKNESQTSLKLTQAIKYNLNGLKLIYKICYKALMTIKNMSKEGHL